MNHLIIINARILTPLGTSAIQGKAMGTLFEIPNGTIEVTDGIITYVGENRSSLPEGYSVFDAEGRVVLPGFIDSHTHLVFGGYRPEEFIWRMKGDSYMSIMERGGGIINTVRATREASFDELKEKAAGKNLIGVAYDNVGEAVDAAMNKAKEEDVIYIGGSTFVVADALEWIGFSEEK